MSKLIKMLFLVIAVGSGFVFVAHHASTRSFFFGIQDMSGLRSLSTVSLNDGQLRYGTTSNLSNTGSTLPSIEALIGWDQTMASAMTPKGSQSESLRAAPAAPEVKDPGKSNYRIEQSPICADRGPGRVDEITYNQRHGPTLRPYASPLASGRGYIDGGTAQGKQSQQASVTCRAR
jgi:hypothetical protein